MSRDVHMRRGVAMLVVGLSMCVSGACHDVVDTPTPPCEQVPADSLRWAMQETPDCSFSGKIVYQDFGLIAGCPSPNGEGFGYSVDPAFAGLWILDIISRERWKVASGGYDPSWSPEGSRVIVAGLYVVDLVDSTITQVPGEGDRWHPAWSPDGQRIAYDEGGWGRSIHVIRLDGSGRRDFAPDPYYWAGMPSWSPDGTRIAHVRQVGITMGDYREIFVMGSDGSGLRRLTSNHLDESDPCYSPDGHMIAFCGQDWVHYSQPDIWIMAEDGGNARQLTNAGALHPTWSPDGRRIIYSGLDWPTSCGPRDLGVLWSFDVLTGENVQITQPWPQQPELCVDASVQVQQQPNALWPNQPLQPPAPHAGQE